MATEFTEQDLDLLITEKMKDCSDLPNVCKLSETETGKKRIFDRVKEIIVKDGIANVEAALANVEEEISWSAE